MKVPKHARYIQRREAVPSRQSIRRQAAEPFKHANTDRFYQAAARACPP